jgi:hypothetical protein
MLYSASHTQNTRSIFSGKTYQACNMHPISYEFIYLILMNFFFGSLTCGMLAASMFPHQMVLTNPTASMVPVPLLLSTLFHTGNISLWNTLYYKQLRQKSIHMLVLHTCLQFMLSTEFGFIQTRCVLLLTCFVLFYSHVSNSHVSAIVIDLYCATIVCIQNTLNFVFFIQALEYV